MIKRLSIALTIVAFAAFGLAACGDDDSDTTAAETTTPATTTSEATTGGDDAAADGETVSFEADPDGALAYTEDKVSAKAGQATISFDNPSSTPHDVVIEDKSGSEVAKTDVITDSTATAEADLEPGSYTYYCSVPGHEQAGMKGTLTVK